MFRLKLIRWDIWSRADPRRRRVAGGGAALYKLRNRVTRCILMRGSGQAPRGESHVPCRKRHCGCGRADAFSLTHTALVTVIGYYLEEITAAVEFNAFMVFPLLKQATVEFRFCVEHQ